MGPLPETQSCEFLEERPGYPCSAGALPYKSPKAGKQHSCGKEYELPAAPRLGGDDGVLWQVAHAAEPGTVLVPQAASGREETCSPEPAGGMLNTEESVEQKPPGAGGEDAAPAPSPGPEDPRGAPAGVQDGGAPEGGPALASDRTPLLRWPQQLHQASQEPGKPLMLPKVTFRKSQLSAAQRWTTAASWQGASGQDLVSPHVFANAAPKVALQGAGEGAAGLIQVGDVETPGNLGSRRLSSESCNAKRIKTPEKKLKARLALAHKTFANFFESKVLDKENTNESTPASLKGQKMSRLLQNSWHAFLKSKGTEGPKRPLVSSGPDPEILNLLRPSGPGTKSHCEEQEEDKENYVFRNHLAPMLSPTPLSPRGLVSPDNRRKSEPTITSPQESGRHWTRMT